MLSDNLGIACYELGQYPKALAAYREALYYQTEAGGDPENVATTLMNLAVLETDAYTGRGKLGNPELDTIRKAALLRAQDYNEQAMRIAKAAKIKHKLISIYYQYALTLSELGDGDRALSLVEKAIRMLRLRGDAGRLAAACNNRGVIQQGLVANSGRALASYETALAYAAEANEHGILKTVLSNYMPALEQAGDGTKAEAIRRRFSNLSGG